MNRASEIPSFRTNSCWYQLDLKVEMRLTSEIDHTLMCGPTQEGIPLGQKNLKKLDVENIPKCVCLHSKCKGRCKG